METSRMDPDILLKQHRDYTRMDEVACGGIVVMLIIALASLTWTLWALITS